MKYFAKDWHNNRYGQKHYRLLVLAAGDPKHFTKIDIYIDYKQCSFKHTFTSTEATKKIVPWPHCVNRPCPEEQMFGATPLFYVLRVSVYPMATAGMWPRGNADVLQSKAAQRPAYKNTASPNTQPIPGEERQQSGGNKHTHLQSGALKPSG